MSYEIIKGIKVDNKRNKLFLRSSSNNVYPKDYPRWEYMPNEKDLEAKKRSLFYNIISGLASLRICDNKNWRYASCRFFDYCNENGIDLDDIYNLYRNNGIDSSEANKYYKIFENFVNEKYKGLYYLSSDVGKITKISHRGFLYTLSKEPNESDCMDYKTAYINRRKLSDETINKYHITINKFEKVKENTVGGAYTL